MFPLPPFEFKRDHDDLDCLTINRLLHRLEPSSSELWQEAKAEIEPEQGMLAIDDTMLDKLYSKHMGLVSRQWSGKLIPSHKEAA